VFFAYVDTYREGGPLRILVWANGRFSSLRTFGSQTTTWFASPSLA
jgi:hypothetical protein